MSWNGLRALLTTGAFPVPVPPRNIPTPNMYCEDVIRRLTQNMHLGEVGTVSKVVEVTPVTERVLR